MTDELSTFLKPYFSLLSLKSILLLNGFHATLIDLFLFILNSKKSSERTLIEKQLSAGQKKSKNVRNENYIYFYTQ